MKKDRKNHKFVAAVKNDEYKKIQDILKINQGVSHNLLHMN